VNADELPTLCEQRDGQLPLAKALREGWLLKRSSDESWFYKVLHRTDISQGGRRVYARLTADALSLYVDEPGSSSGRGRQPIEVMFLSSISAVIGREQGSRVLRLVHARGVWWTFEQSNKDHDMEAWGKDISSRLGHFRQAKRQSQRLTHSTIAHIKDPKNLRRLNNRRIRRMVHRWLPCCDPCVGTVRSSSNAFALTRRLSNLKDPMPWRGEREFTSGLVDSTRLAEVSDPELQEAQGAYWSEQVVRYLKCCHMIPEELALDFTLTLRMGAPDGLKRMIWPLAAGEPVEAPRIVTRSGAAATSTTHKDPGTVYEGVLQRAFGDVRPDKLQDPVPTFCQGISGMEEAPPLRSVIKHLSLLTENGENALRRLLWVIQLTTHQVEFCPFLPNLIATLLTFFDEAETLVIVTGILREAEQEPYPDKASNLRIIWNSVQINKQAKLFLREGKRKTIAPEALAHLEELGFDLHALAVEMLQDGLATRISFRALCRVVGSFLREGSEVILRYGLALLKLRTPQILACKTAEEAKKVLENLGEGMTTCTAIDQLSKAAFSFVIKDTSMARVSSFWGSEYVAPRTNDYKPHMFCRPRLFPPRGHCPDDLWASLWAWVPTSCRIFDPHLVYTPGTHGTSLRTCLEICKKHQESPMIFFVYTKEGDIIGGFSPNIFVRTNGYFKLRELRRPAEDAFVFRKLHTRKGVDVFSWSGFNEMLLKASDIDGLVFGGDAAAVAIGRDMHRASTSTSATFSSPVLVLPLPDEEDTNEGADGVRKDKSSVELCGKETADFEMYSFEIFALL